MAVCDHCGNDYDKSFTISSGGETHTFDSFNAQSSLAPKCAHCDCRISVTASEAEQRHVLLRCIARAFRRAPVGVRSSTFTRRSATEGRRA